MQTIVTKKITGVTTTVWILAIPMILGFYALSNIDNDVEFKTLNTFFILYLSSGFGILMAQSNIRGWKNHMEDLQIFWTNDIDRNGIKWIGLGLLGIFVSVGLTLALGSGLDANGLRYVQAGGILLAGIMMMIAFLKTNAILVPIIIHGVYNSFVVFLKKTSFEVIGGTEGFAGIPIRVPEIGIGFKGLADLYSEMIWQFFLVATSEEFLKLGILIMGTLLVYNQWQSKGMAVFLSAGVSVVFWTLLHSIQALFILPVYIGAMLLT